MLKVARKKWHKVARGQTLKSIAKTYCLSEYAIASVNRLTEEVTVGQILYLPDLSGNQYTAKEGEDKILLCGSVENYEKRNGRHLYPGKRVTL